MMKEKVAQVVRLVPIFECSKEQIHVAAQGLHEQWPRGGSVADYLDKITSSNVDSGGGDDEPKQLVSTEQQQVPVESQQQQQLPCSYLLIGSGSSSSTSGSDDDDDESGVVVIGHGRLTECFEGAGGKATAATYILIMQSYRGQGYGSQLMRLLEQTTIALGYHYLYLWTTTAIEFYKKLAYAPTHRVSLFSACLKSLQCDHVSKLEAILLSKRNGTNGTTMTTTKRHETVMLPPEDEEQEHDDTIEPTLSKKKEDIWLRKRLVECLPSKILSVEERMEEIHHAIRRCRHDDDNNKWQYLFHNNIPWQPQVGPSCGLTALRMLHEYYYYYCKDDVDDDNNNNNSYSAQEQSRQEQQQSLPSLLQYAQDKSYTIDGEMFHIDHLHNVATICCQLDTHVVSSWSTLVRPSDIIDTLRKGGTYIIPYDSQPTTTKRPCCNHGRTAHYGIIVGILVSCRTGSSSLTTQPAVDDDDDDTAVLLPFDRDVVVDGGDYDDDDALLIVQHSLSPHLLIALYNDFYSSNQQLHTVDTTKYATTAITPTTMTLQDRALLCHGRQRIL